MDVERLMQDLTIDQLKNIQQSLSQKSEEKREELRRMVGRRYRDVLEASNTVRRLTEIASNLVCEIHDTRQIARSGTREAETRLPVKVEAIWRIGLLNKLVPMLTDKIDGLSDVFALVLAENLHRSVTIEIASFESAGIAVSNGLRIIGDFLISHRLSLLDRLQGQLGAETDWQEVAGLLAAIALLKQMTLEELLEVYLTSRKNHIVASLKSYSTLISIIEMMKFTTECVDDVFGKGNAVVSALKYVTEEGWCPAEIFDTVGDQISCYSSQLGIEIKKVNKSYSKDFAKGLSGKKVEADCTAWIEILCETLEDRIKSMCDFFEKTSEMVEFIDIVNNIFSSEWPAVQSNAAVYQKLFGSSLLDRYKLLVTGEMRNIEFQLINEAASANTNPPPLFQKRGTRFDPLLASGVSKDMHELIQKVFSQLQELLNNTNKYVSIGQEKNIGEIHDHLADAALEITKHITSLEEFGPVESEKEKWLIRFRIFLALVQHEPSVLCQCMNRKTAHIVECNKLLHWAAEEALCKFMELIIEETIHESRIETMPDYVSNPVKFLDLAQELEKYKLPESETVVEIPTQISRLYFGLLYTICQKTNSYSVGHLFTRNVTTKVATLLGEKLSKSMIDTAKACSTVPAVCTQVIFDAKALFFMFVNRDFMEAVEIVEEKLDPITKAVLDEAVSRNAKLFVQRTSLLFGQLQADPPTSASSKDIEIAQSYSALIDIAPILPNIPRLPLIPGLSFIEQRSVDDKPKELKKKKQDKQQDLQSLTGLLGKPSISSFVDKFSSNWFKN